MMMCAVSLVAAAQFPSLPYNPDENGDGLIGVVDLQGLLANYGNEFASAVVSEDGESAITYMGDMAYPLCAQACRNLPGMWEMPFIEDLGLVWNDINQTSNIGVWLKAEDKSSFGQIDNNNVLRQFQYFYSYSKEVLVESQMHGEKRCYCAAKQLPRVEYSVCAGTVGNTGFHSAASIETCCQQKVSEGWLPLGGTAESQYTTSQAFWRWAE